MTTLAPDICVIGAGSGGLSVAAGAAAFGVSVVLVERNRMGGDCLHTGCVPSKALLAAAFHAQAARDAHSFGVLLDPPRTDWPGVEAHLQNTIAAIAPNDSVERFTGLGVQVMEAEARFIDRHTLQAGNQLVRARRFVVATGSTPAIPDIPGLGSVPYLTNETIFACQAGFDHLIIVGAGPVGVELAQACRRLGADVTLIGRGAMLGRDDPELVQVVRTRLRAEGVTILERTKVIRVEHADDRIRLFAESAEGEKRVIEGSHLLVATGRKARTGSLGLEQAGVSFGGDGIVVSSGLRTSNRRIYAVGDVVAGSPRLTHAASYHAGLVIRATLFRLPVCANPAHIPHVTYTSPELAQIGRTEARARAEGLRFSVHRCPFNENDRAQAEGETAGLVKVIAGRGGKILGVGIAGAHAGESIHLWSLAVAKKLTLGDVARYVAPYPTFGEAGRRAAVAYFASAARNPWLRKFLHFLRLWG